jgi:hypothetical protein
LAVLFAGVAPASAAEPRADGGTDGGTPPAPVCVTWSAEARYRPYGYDHLVHLKNGCDQPAVCRVTTNVNPTPAEARVLPKQTATVVTFQGSPAREFAANVACVLER